MARFVTVAVALVVFAASTYVFIVGVAISPVGSWVRRVVFDMEYGSCIPDWREVFQLGPGVGAFAASAAALYRSARPSVSMRPTWLLAATAVILVVAWGTASAAGIAESAATNDPERKRSSGGWQERALRAGELCGGPARQPQ